jgi:hypothetical protein
MQVASFLLILIFACAGCQRNSAPDEIVKIVPGKSLMEQVAPTLKRQHQNNRKIILVQDSVTSSQMDSHFKASASSSSSSTPKYQTLYISGKKSKDKKDYKEKMDKLIEAKKAGK